MKSSFLAILEEYLSRISTMQSFLLNSKSETRVLDNTILNSVKINLVFQANVSFQEFDKFCLSKELRKIKLVGLNRLDCNVI